MRSLLSFFILVNFIYFALSDTFSTNTINPEQIHISYGAQFSEIYVTWITWNTTQQSIANLVTASTIGTNLIIDSSFIIRQGVRFSGSERLYVDGGSHHRDYFVHRVVLTGLLPNTHYAYNCGVDGAWSETFEFRTPNYQKWTPRLAIYGDMGLVNNQILDYVLKDSVAGRIDSVLHIGDIAYDMCDKQSQIGDSFFNLIQPLAATTPYMLIPGNHEHAYNFSDYRRIVTMPGGDGEGQFYSYNVGPAHIVVMSTEFYYYVGYGWRQIQRQFDWLEADLAEANKPENRALHPWIIVVGHRPMYCSGFLSHEEHCDTIENFVRVGIPFRGTYLFAPEELFYEAGVDLMFFGHEHNYERFWPVYNRRVCNGSDPSNPYRNPAAPVHVVTGGAGNKEYTTPFSPNPWPWSAFRSVDYSYTRLTLHNASHVYFEQVSTDQGGKVIDSACVIKDAHGPGTYHCH